MPVQRRRKWHIPACLAMGIDFEWAIELLYNSVKTGSQLVGDQMSFGEQTSWRRDELETRCGRESHHPAEGALGTHSEFGDQLVRRCWDENMSQKGWAPRPPVEHPGEQERERHTAMSGGAGEVNILQFCSVSNSLSHTNL